MGRQGVVAMGMNDYTDHWEAILDLVDVGKKASAEGDLISLDGVLTVMMDELDIMGGMLEEDLEETDG